MTDQTKTVLQVVKEVGDKVLEKRIRRLFRENGGKFKRPRYNSIALGDAYVPYIQCIIEAIQLDRYKTFVDIFTACSLIGTSASELIMTNMTTMLPFKEKYFRYTLNRAIEDYSDLHFISRILSSIKNIETFLQIERFLQTEQIMDIDYDSMIDGVFYFSNLVLLEHFINLADLPAMDKKNRESVISSYLGAACKNIDTRNIKITVDWLLSHVYMKYIHEEHGFTIFMLLAARHNNIGVIEYLLENNNLTEKDNYCGLIEAIKHENISICDYLLDHCPSAYVYNLKSRNYKSPLARACQFGSLHVVKFLFEDVNILPELQDLKLVPESIDNLYHFEITYGQDPIQLAVDYGNFDIPTYLMPENSFVETYLARHYDGELLKKLVDNCHLNCNGIGFGGTTLLHWACIAGNMSAVTYLLEDYGATYSHNHIGLTPLDCAINARQYDIERYLKEMGKEPSTPLSKDAMWEIIEKELDNSRVVMYYMRIFGWPIFSLGSGRNERLLRVLDDSYDG